MLMQNFEGQKSVFGEMWMPSIIGFYLFHMLSNLN